MDQSNQNNPTGQTPAEQALPPVTPPAEPIINQAPANPAPTNQTLPADTPSQNPPVETPPTNAPLPPIPVETPPPEAPVEPAPSNQVPPGFDQPASPPSPQQAAEPTVESPVEQMGAENGAPAPETSAERPKSSAWKWIIGIMVIAILGGGGYYYYITKIKTSPSSSTSSETTSTGTSNPGTSPTVNSTSESAIETVYNKAVAITATTDKARAVDTVLAPILEKTFADNVKLTDASSVLTYTTNRTILAADVTSVKTQLETAGYKAIDSTEKQMTMSKGASTWVITFSVGSETKATIDVTY